MKPFERVALWITLAAALTALLATGLFDRPLHAQEEAGEKTDVAKPLIAVCAVPAIINDLMASDRFEPDFLDRQEELREEVQPLIEELEELQAQLTAPDADPEDPALQLAFERFQQLRNQLAQLSQQHNATLDGFRAKQIIEAYELIKASAQAVATELGFEYVISSADDFEELAESTQIVVRQLTVRPVMMYPEAADITEAVRDDLNLE
ncbi:MAG: OmpH family outer membrane protein [Planctomycetota bacterium]